METNDVITQLQELTTRPMTRRRPIVLMGLLAGVAGVPALLAACGSATTTTQGPAGGTAAGAAVPAVPTVAVATPQMAVPTAANAAPVTAGPISVTAKEDGDNLLFDVDRLAIPAGPVQVTFKNAGKMVHEVYLYPVQDLTSFLAQRRAGVHAEEADYIKHIVGNVEDADPGKGGEFQGTLTPGFYELACFVMSKRPDGSTYVHFDKGQSVTIAAIGPGGPSADVLTPASEMKVQMLPGEGDLARSWLFVPDRLVVTAGKVTFTVTNHMDEEHDFVVYRLGDISTLVANRLAGKKSEDDYKSVHGDEIMEDLPKGQTWTRTMDLTPGMWAAACFMVSKSADGSSFLHRDRAQRFTFVVK